MLLARLFALAHYFAAYYHAVLTLRFVAVSLMVRSHRSFLTGQAVENYPHYFVVHHWKAAGFGQTVGSLHHLVGQSMVAFLPGTPTSRFRLLEPIRQFCQRAIDADTLNPLLERHADWFATRVTELAQDMRGANEIEACEALTAEWSDFGRALAWGRNNNRADVAVDPLLALHIHLLWQLRIEAFGWLEAGVAACDLTPDVQARADLVRSMGAWSGGDLDRSEALMEAAIANGGATIETDYFEFYLGFAREDFEKVEAMLSEARKEQADLLKRVEALEAKNKTTKSKK